MKDVSPAKVVCPVPFSHADEPESLLIRKEEQKEEQIEEQKEEEVLQE